MESKFFSEVLRDAINGNPYAVEALIMRYMPLINKHSTCEGRVDDDMRQYIILRVICQTQKFDILRRG